MARRSFGGGGEGWYSQWKSTFAIAENSGEWAPIKKKDVTSKKKSKKAPTARRNNMQTGKCERAGEKKTEMGLWGTTCRQVGR